MNPDTLPTGFKSGPSDASSGRVLAVILHGYRGSSTTMSDILDATNGALGAKGNLDTFVPNLPYARWYSVASPTDVTVQLLADMDDIGAGSERYSTIYLIGFSMGAVIARRMFLVAAGMNSEVPSEGSLQAEKPRDWAGKVQRIVTLGGLNRGWIRSGRYGWVESIIATLVGVAGRLLKPPSLFYMRRGAPFIVHTRLALRQNEQRRTPLVVQLLGTQDNLVGPDDAVDFAVDDGNSDYLYVELPQTGHEDAIVFDPRLVANGPEPRGIFTAALNEDLARMARRSIDRRFLADTLPPRPEHDVAHVVFVIHGIRDDGYWTRRIAQHIRQAAHCGGHAGTYRCITSSYGYFAMLPFVWPWIRAEKVEWLMDEFVSAKARYPNARFSYVGHSNGTYLLARALRDYPATCFHNVFFAGSVVRRDYNWQALINSQRVRRLVNMVATADWVVAIFPSALERWRRFDLGGAGFGGFTQAPEEPAVRQVEFVAGAHSAGLVEPLWPYIAEFIVTGELRSPPHSYVKASQSPLWMAASRHSTLVLMLGLILILSPAVVMLYIALHFSAATTVLVAATFGWLMLVWFVITRV
jgi:pimeloyl-ACP methyl ester carboxylesterase